MVAYILNAPGGVAGDITRPDNTVVEPIMLAGSGAPTVFGCPIKLSTGKAAAFAGNETAADFAGFLARSVPAISGSVNSGFADGTPNASFPQNLVTRGYLNVLCTVGTPVRGGKVYARVVADTGKAVGDIEATADVTVAGGTITGTGTGTISASVTADAIPGTWSLVLQSTSQTAKVTVIDPNGLRHPDATVGTAYTSGGLTFTITAAGTMTSGDSFAPVVTAKNIALPGVRWASDGKDASNNAEVRIGQIA